MAVSLGSTKSLTEHPYTMTHADVALEDLAQALRAMCVSRLLTMSVCTEESRVRPCSRSVW